MMMMLDGIRLRSFLCLGGVALVWEHIIIMEEKANWQPCCASMSLGLVKMQRAPGGFEAPRELSDL